MSDDDFFVDINWKICQPVVNVDDIISDDNDENDLKYKYCLDGIDTDELFDYIAEINNEERMARNRGNDDS